MTLYRCAHLEAFGQCASRTARVFHVNGIPGTWPGCAHHGKALLKALMAAYPGHGVYTRRTDR